MTHPPVKKRCVGKKTSYMSFFLTRTRSAARLCPSSSMATTLQQVQAALGTDKFTVLAVAVDQALEARTREASMDEQIETLDVQDLAGNYGTTFETLRKQISDSVGAGAVFKLGKKWVIRKQTFLQFLQARERSGDT